MYRVAYRRIDSGLDEEVVVFQRKKSHFDQMGGNWEERIQKETTVLQDQFQSIGSHKSDIIYTIAAIEIQNKHQE